MNQSNIILLKNLIENEKFEQAYKIRDEFVDSDKDIYRLLSTFNFGSTLLLIDDLLYKRLEDDRFKSFFTKKNAENNFDTNKINSFDETDNDRDYFNAMTDGQYGDYDDFNESGGDINDIDDWARG